MTSLPSGQWKPRAPFPQRQSPCQLWCRREDQRGGAEAGEDQRACGAEQAETWPCLAAGWAPSSLRPGTSSQGTQPGPRGGQPAGRVRAPAEGPCCLREEQGREEEGQGGRRSGRKEAGEEGGQGGRRSGRKEVRVEGGQGGRRLGRKEAGEEGGQGGRRSGRKEVREEGGQGGRRSGRKEVREEGGWGGGRSGRKEASEERGQGGRRLRRSVVREEGGWGGRRSGRKEVREEGGQGGRRLGRREVREEGGQGGRRSGRKEVREEGGWGGRRSGWREVREEGGWGGGRSGVKEAGRKETMRSSKEPKAPAQAVSLTAMCKSMTPPHGPCACNDTAGLRCRENQAWAVPSVVSLPAPAGQWLDCPLPPDCPHLQGLPCRDRGGELRKSHLTAPSEQPLPRFL